MDDEKLERLTAEEFLQVLDRAAFDRELPGNAIRLLLLYLVHGADISASIDKLARMFGFSRVSIVRFRRMLTERNYIDIGRPVRSPDARGGFLPSQVHVKKPAEPKHAR